MIINFDNFLNEELFDSKPYELTLLNVKDGAHVKVYTYQFTTNKDLVYLVICPIGKQDRTLDICFAPKYRNILSSLDMVGDFDTSKIFATLKVIIDKHDKEFDKITAFSEPKRIKFYKSLFLRMGYKILKLENNYLMAEKPKGTLNENKLTYKLYRLYFFLKYFSKKRNEFRKLSRNSRFVKEMTLPLSDLELGHPVGDPFDFKLKKRIQDAKKLYSDDMKIISKKELEEVFPSVSDIKVIKMPNGKYKVIDGNGRVYVLKQIFKDLMVDVSLYEPVLQESRSNRFDKIMEIINNAKIGDILPNDIVYQYVQELHCDDDFIDGDLGDRLDEYDEYKLKKLDLDEIDLDEFNLCDDIANDYGEEYKKSGYYPPIVVGSKNEYYNSYGIIDGTHRANGLKNVGEKYILAFVGVD